MQTMVCFPRTGFPRACAQRHNIRCTPVQSLQLGEIEGCEAPREAELVSV